MYGFIPQGITICRTIEAFQMYNSFQDFVNSYLQCSDDDFKMQGMCI